MAIKYTYKAPPTGQRFHDAMLGTYLYKGIRGVPGSGKSVVCDWDIIFKSEMQPPIWDEDSQKSVRWSKWAIVRNTFHDLTETTIPTLLNWFPLKAMTDLHKSHPIKGTIEAPSMHKDGTWLRIELVFYAAEAETFMNSLDSLEVSGAYVNEAAQVDWNKIHKLQERVGRFKPPGAAAQGWKGLSFGVIMDTNTPLETSWWYRLEQVEKPDRMLWFIQPPAIIRTKDSEGKIIYLRNDEKNSKRFGTSGPAENVENHNEGWDYYEKQLVGADEDYIKTRLLNEYGRSKGGLPVYAEYSDELHCSKEKLQVLNGVRIVCGHDFGRNPACAIGQVSPSGQVRIIREVVAFNMGVPRFIDEKFLPVLIELGYPNIPVIVFGDPEGENPSAMSELGPIPYLNSRGIQCVIPECLRGSNNDISIRLNSVSELLRGTYKGVPDILIDPSCEYLRNGFNGDYHYRTMKTASGEKYSDKPDKNEYSHIHDALQYLACGIRGGGSRFVGAGGYQTNSAPLPITYDMGYV